LHINQPGLTLLLFANLSFIIYALTITFFWFDFSGYDYLIKILL